MIGSRNRAHLRNLVKDAAGLALFQDRYVRHGHMDFFHGPTPVPWPLNRLDICHKSDTDEPQTVDYLEPAIEACFRILGGTGSSLTLKVALPPVFRIKRGNNGGSRIQAIEFVEKSRERYGANRVLVLWEVKWMTTPRCDLDKCLAQRELYKAAGWEIVAGREDPIFV